MDVRKEAKQACELFFHAASLAVTLENGYERCLTARSEKLKPT